MFRSGKMPKNAQYPLARRYVECDTSRKTWIPEYISRVRKIPKEIEKEFRVKLSISKDKCLYFGLPKTMPDDWG